MLTGDLVRPRMSQRNGKLILHTLRGIPQEMQTAADLITLFNAHLGQTLGAWDDALSDYEGERMDYVVIRGLAKVLTDAATLNPPQTALPPADIRRLLFSSGPVFANRDLFHPQNRTERLQAVADQHDITTDALEATLFADRPNQQIITEIGTDWTPQALITRYNLELHRAALYWAREMHIEIHDTFKDFWRYLKLFKLMFWATVNPEGGYHVALDGPISPFVRSTTRYGRQFAAFLPALLLCERWHMQTMVYPPQFEGALTYTLDPSTPLRSHFKRSGEFDSQLEADFAAAFAAKFGDKRGKWTLTREDEVILLGDTVMIPDFALTHQPSGQRVLLEIVGFWHPDYLRRKVAKVREANRADLLLLVYEGVNLTPNALQDVPSEVLYFKNKPVLKDVIATVEDMI